jgi:diadenosine tetraphosphate (Ap4A) HIT family hydrolase
MVLPTIVETPFLIAEPCIDCDVSGYLVLRSKAQSQHLYQLPAAFQRSLGSILARLEKAITNATRAEHVYIARFSEALAATHFHMFPRTRQLATEFLREHVTAESVNGPLLYDWARTRYHVDRPEQLSLATLAVADEIAAELRRI